MWFIVRIVLIFLFGFGMAKSIEDNPIGAVIMGIISVGMTVWLVHDVLTYPQYYQSMLNMVFAR